jgi:hypothetical protein
MRKIDSPLAPTIVSLKRLGGGNARSKQVVWTISLSCAELGIAPFNLSLPTGQLLNYKRVQQASFLTAYVLLPPLTANEWLGLLKAAVRRVEEQVG